MSIQIRSNLYIKANKGNFKCGLYEQLPFIHRLKSYALLINGEKKPLKTVICYIDVPFKTVTQEFSCKFKNSFKTQVVSP